MAKSRYETRSRTAPQRTSNNSKKAEKWEVMKGWITPAADDDDIVSWTKVRRQAEEKAKERRSRRPNDYEPYLGGLSAHCDDIDDFCLFKLESLSSNSKPKPNKDLNNDGKFLERTVKHEKIAEKKNETHVENVSDSTSKEHGSSHQKTTAIDDAGPSEEGGKARSASATNPTDKSRETNSINSNDQKRSASARDCVPEDPKNQTNNGRNNNHGKNGKTENTHGNSTNGATNKMSNGESQTKNKQPEMPPRSIKLSYTQSNITLKNPYSNLDYDAGVEDKGLTANPSTPTKLNSQSVSSMTGEESENGVVDSTTGLKSGLMVTSLHDLREKVGSQSDNNLASQCHPVQSELGLHSQSNHYVDSALCNGKPEDNVQLSGLSVATLKSSQIQNGGVGGEDTQGPKKGMSQKQVSIVLRKVTLQDSSTAEITQQSTFPSHPTSFAGRRVSQTGSRDDTPEDSSRELMPLSDLLPVVDNNIKSRLNLVGKSNKTETETDEQDLSLTERLLHYEDSLILTRDGTELIRLKDRQQTMLGPPAFKPQSVKSPLQRAKENTSKRLLGHPNTASYSDISRIRWTSSSGTMYTGNVVTRGNGASGHSPEGEARSAPVTGRITKRKQAGYHSQGTINSAAHKNEISELSGRFGSRMMELIRRRTSGVDFRYAVPD